MLRYSWPSFIPYRILVNEEEVLKVREEVLKMRERAEAEAQSLVMGQRPSGGPCNEEQR